MEQITYFIGGIFIGIGLILPGVSGAVLAIALGIYDKLIKAFSNIFKDFKKNMLFLMPVFLGLAVGTILFGKIVLYLYTTYEVATKSAFLGLILGSMPILFNKLKDTKKESAFKYLPFAIALSLGVVLFIANDLFMVKETATTLGYDLVSLIKLFTAGIFYAVGKVLPGVSSSFMLMALGLYEYILSLISNPLLIFKGELLHTLIFGFGFLFGVIILSKIVAYLLKHYKNHTYSAIIGFVIGSLFILIPKYDYGYDSFVAITIMFTAFMISYMFSRYENGKK